LEVDVDDINFYYRSTNSSVARSNLRTQNSNFRPNPAEEYVVRIRVRNTATPTSSTTFTLQSLILDDHTRTAVEVVGGRGTHNQSQGIPVISTGGVINAWLRNRRITYTDSTTALAVNASFTGTTRDLGTDTSLYPAYAIARAYADQAGTLYIEQSRDGTTWRAAVGDSVALAAEETRTLTVRLLARYWRVKYVNGATAQTAFELISCTSEV
jgi:hypothetical protein